jgi:hypothetical protein
MIVFDYLTQRLNFFRATFGGTEEMIETGIIRFSRVIKDFFDGQASNLNL